ncbi:Serine/threonine-protein kinase RIO1 [Linum perenne]
MSVIVESSEHVEQHAGEEEGEDDELSWSSDSEIADALDWLDAKDNGEAGEGSFALNSRRPNAHGGLHSRPSSSTLQPLSNRNQKFTHHIRAAPLEEWEGRTNFGMSNTVTTAIRGSVRDMAIGKTRVTEKADRATVEQAIDPRTRMVLFKMINRGIFNDINGCISTGKEANVYHATKSNGQELAIKVYKTSVLVFKLKAAGIRCPTTHLLRLHVLVMEFIGKDGWAAPRLKDASLSLDRLREGYMEMIMIMRTLYQKCKLVHGDLSEYNILYYEGHLYIIDVSQSVDLDHPRALDFLREDCVHVSDFFKKHGVAVMNIRELFDFIVDPSITDDSIDNYLEEVQKRITSREVTVEDEIADSVFVQAYIPKRLDSVKDAEEDVIRLTSGQKTDDLYYKVITGLTDPKNDPQEKGKPGEESLVNEESDDDDNPSDSDSDDESSCRSDTTEIKSQDDRKAARKENKKKVKEEKRESRKTKVPKALKKRKKKLSKAKKTR